jgi:hypothetical protein
VVTHRLGIHNGDGSSEPAKALIKAVPIP